MTKRLTLLSPAEVQDLVDPLAPDLDADPKTAGADRLPYHLLQGPGFERLCYELQVAEGHNPRFFGRSGQRDYEVDLVVEHGDVRKVLQCKNEKRPPAWTKLRDAVAKFEEEWLGEAQLPPPTEFIYCCPHALDDSTLGVQWTKLRDEVRRRTGVEVSFLDGHGIDSCLRKLPDVVAGLFSPAYAELFCGRDDWRDDPWTRVQWGKARHAPVDRFLTRHQRGEIYTSTGEEDVFQDLLARAPVVALVGAPGAGKTVTGLALAARLPVPARRIYYATLNGVADVERLWMSVRRRSGLPSLFVLDDCHLDLAKTGRFLERLSPELSSSDGRVKILLMLRRASLSSDDLDDTPEWLRRLHESGLVVEMATGVARTRVVMEHLRPTWSGLSKKQLDRLHHVSGGDLMLLDEVLKVCDTPADLETLRPDSLYQPLRGQYFGGNRRLPTVLRLACLAQFELVPRAELLDSGWQPGEKDLVAPLLTTLYAPPRYQFIHSSLAELVTRALLELESDGDLEEALAGATQSHVLAHLHHIAGASAAAADAELLATLDVLLKDWRLKLMDKEREARVKAAVLADGTVMRVVEACSAQCSFIFFNNCVKVLHIADHPAKSSYVALVEARFQRLLGQSDWTQDALGIATMGVGLSALKRFAPEILIGILEEYSTKDFLQLIMSGTLFELLRVLESSTPSFRKSLLAELNQAAVERLVQQTISAGRSIGTLNLAMREPGLSDEVLLAQLESTIGARRFLRLVQANGTVFELFRLLQSSTPPFRKSLLAELDEATAERIVQQTISAGRSIGTLNLAMRKLGLSDEALLARLESAIGAGRFLRLIQANGTLFELLHVLRFSTPPFRASLLDELDEAAVERLVQQTISAGRSIGTLNLAMRELGVSDEALLARLESAIGAGRFLRLIQANGTLFELLHVLRFSTPPFRDFLLEELDEAAVERLVQKTMSSGRSIGTFNLAMRELGLADEALLARLESAIGAGRFLRLIQANGTLFELFKLLGCSTPPFRDFLLEELDEAAVERLVQKTILSGRSIGTLHLAMRELGLSDEALLARLESAIGADRFLRLIQANGTLFELFKLLSYSTPPFRAFLLDELDEAAVERLVQQTISSGRSIGTLHLARRELRLSDEALLARLESAIGAGRFLHLIQANGTLFELFRVLQYSTPPFRKALLAEMDEGTAGALVDQTITAGKSIESLHFTLSTLARSPKQRERLEQLLGQQGWWRLFTGAGSLHGLAQTTRAMTEEFRTGIIAASTHLSESQWTAIIQRGLFISACSFATEELSQYPPESQDAFCEALRGSASALADRATWFDLNPSRPPAEPGSQVASILRDALRERSAKITPDDLVGLDFREAVNGLSFTWRERPDLRASLAERLWEILPAPADWPREKGEITASRLVLNVARSELIPREDARRLVAAVVAFLDPEVLAESHTLPLFLLLWDLESLQYDRTLSPDFGRTLPDELLNAVVALLHERAQKGGNNDEKLWQLSLAGLVRFLAPQLHTRLHRALKPLAKSLSWLHQKALEQTFVPAFFALEGLAIRNSQGVYNRFVCFGLQAKSEEYDEGGPSIQYLRRRVEEIARSGHR